MTPSPEAVIVGGGLIGMACAIAVAERGGSAILLDRRATGAASPAAAGMLAPSVERAEGAASDFATLARDRYPSYLAWLEETTGVSVPLNRRGILQVAIGDRGARGLRRSMPGTATWIDAADLHGEEPALSHAVGAVHHPLDGAVDNVALIAALDEAIRRSRRVRRVSADATEILTDRGSAAVRTSDGTVHRGGRVVIAAGAWTAGLRGLPRAIPVVPMRGQMLSYPPVALEHVLFGPRGYVVPRVAHGSSPAAILVGATTESVGFDSGITESAAHRLHEVGTEIVPALSAAPARQWAGLRPMTPDLLPILGPDPDAPEVIYSCGHSRNGILLAPLTGDCVAALVLGEPVGHDLSPFRADRFRRL